MKLVIIESPFAGDIERNRTYLQLCIRDSLRRGEAPFASHQMYTHALNDDDPAERGLGIAAGGEWYRHAELVAVYNDFGISKGMAQGINWASALHLPVVYRSIIN